MVTGFNSDIEHGGTVFHVQTEEKGPDDPVVVTLVYCGGEIVTSVESSYGELLGGEGLDPDEIRRRMKIQHEESIRAVRRGRFAPAGVPFGQEWISDRSLDEVVLDYLERSIDAVRRSRPPQAAGSVATDRVLRRLETFLAAAQRGRDEAAERTGLAGHAFVVPAPASETAAGPIRFDRSPGASPAAGRRRRHWIGIGAAAALAACALGLALRGPETARSGAEAPVVAASPPIAAGPPSPVPADLAGGGEPVAAPPLPTAPGRDAAGGSDAEASAAAALPLPPETASRPTPRESETATGVVEASPAVPPVAVTPSLPPVPRPAGPSEDAGAPLAEPLAPPAEAEAPIEAPPRVEPGALVDLAAVDLPPDPRRRPLPRYTRRARRLQQEGTVRLAVLVDQHGSVEQVRLLEGIAESDLGQASVEVARGWEFSPARKDGNPVRVWLEAAFDFEIRPDRSTRVRIRE